MKPLSMSYRPPEASASVHFAGWLVVHLAIVVALAWGALSSGCDRAALPSTPSAPVIDGGKAAGPDWHPDYIWQDFDRCVACYLWQGHAEHMDCVRVDPCKPKPIGASL